MNAFIGEQVISILRDNSFEKEADQLEQLLSEIVSDEENLKKVAIETIVGCCQIQAYGNLNIKTINGWKWNSMLEKLRKYAMRKSENK